MSIILILTLIPLITSLLNKTLPQTIAVCLFAFDFLVIGIISTYIIYPKASLKTILRKLVLVLGFAIIFSLISAIITIYVLQLSMNSILLLMSIISVILLLLALYRNKHDENITNIKINIDQSAQKTLYIIIILGLIALVSMLIPPFNVIPIWYGLCAPFIVFLPGYYIMNTIIPKKDELLYLERAGISLFLSLIMASIIGLILYAFENVIDMKQVSIILIFMTLLLIIPAYVYRIKKIDNKFRFTHPKTNRLLLFITIIGLLCMILVGIQITSEKLTPGNTTFVVDGIEKTAKSDGYIYLSSGENITSNVNITNNEHKTMKYTMKIEAHNETSKVIMEKKVTLKKGKSKVIPVNLTMTPGRKDIQYVLYTEKGKPYFIRHLKVDVASE